MRTPGIYALVLRVEASTEMAIGRLGRANVPEGYYLYLGSALGGLSQRLARHQTSPHRIH